MKKLALLSLLFFGTLNTSHIKAATQTWDNQGFARISLTRENIARLASYPAFESLSISDANKMEQLSPKSQLFQANAEDEDLSELTFKGVFFFPLIDFSGSDFSNSTLKAFFHRCSLHAVNFKNFTLVGSLSFCNCSEADFEGADLREVFFNPTTIKGACFSFANFSGMRFESLDFSKLKFKGANLKGCNLEKVKQLEEADFSGACLEKACFGALSSLKGTNFTHADLRNASLECLTMSLCEGEPLFMHADLRGAKLLSDFFRVNNSLKGAIVTENQIKKWRLTPTQVREEKGLLASSHVEMLCFRYIKEGIEKVTDQIYHSSKLQCNLSSLTLRFYLADFNPKSKSRKKKRKSKPLPR